MPDKKPPAGKPSKGKPGKSPSPPGKSAGGINKKVGGLPLWAWGALVLGAVAVGLYFRHRSGGATTGQSVAQPETSGQDTSGAGDVGGGIGSAPSDGSGSDLAGAIEDLATVLGANPPPTVTDDGGNAGTAPGSEATNSNTLAGFWWGGKFFTNAASFAKYAKQHGINLPQFYANHPFAARSIGVTPPPPKPSNGGRAAKAVTPQSKPQKATQHTAHPVSSHPQAAAVQQHAAVAAAPKPKPAAAPKAAPKKAAPAKHRQPA